MDRQIYREPSINPNGPSRQYGYGNWEQPNRYTDIKPPLRQWHMLWKIPVAFGANWLVVAISLSNGVPLFFLAPFLGIADMLAFRGDILAIVAEWRGSWEPLTVDEARAKYGDGIFGEEEKDAD